MMNTHGPISPQAWLANLFSSKAARDGQVIRRKLRDVDRFVGRDALRAELARRGYHAVENAGQLVIFCNQEPIRLILRLFSDQKTVRKMFIFRTPFRRALHARNV